MGKASQELKKRHADYMREWRKNHPEYVEKQKKYFAAFRQANPNYFQDYNKKWLKNHPQKVLERMRRYRRKYPEKEAERRAKYAKRHPDRKSARRRALKIDVEQCDICGSRQQIERHHPDYSQPMIITPLCHDCHVKEHQMEGAPKFKEASP